MWKKCVFKDKFEPKSAFLNSFVLQAQFALNTATILLDYYDEFFKTPYPLEKQGLSVNDVTKKGYGFSINDACQTLFYKDFLSIQKC